MENRCSEYLSLLNKIYDKNLVPKLINVQEDSRFTSYNL